MSTRPRIYLDFNATAPLIQAARDAMVEAMADVGNPSSIHAEGRRMRDRVERARNQVAALVGRPREQVVFTSGGTEANWLGVMALAAAAEARGLPKVVMTTPIEHPSLKGAVAALAARGWKVVVLRTHPDHGVIPPDKDLGPGELYVDRTPDIEASGVGLFAAAMVNHELGAILDPYIVGWAKDGGALVHLDAVQAAGKVDGELDARADSLAISGHKIGGPQGVGALAIADDRALPLVDGGHQERGRRPGTENALGIIGFGAAAGAVSAVLEARRARVLEAHRVATEHSIIGEDATTRAMRIHERVLAATDADREGTWEWAAGLGYTFEDRLRETISGAHVFSNGYRVGSTVNVRFEGARGESIVMGLDLEGISASTGAACTSGSIQPSAVLLGLGLSEEQAREGVRFSLGPSTTTEEISRVLEVLPGIVERARRHR